MPISVATPPRLRRLAPALRAIVRAALARDGFRAGEIAIVLTGDAELRALNQRWRGLDRATDVLSFDYGDSRVPAEPTLVLELGRKRAARARSPRAVVSGDLVISLDRMAEQARRYRVSRGRELARLVIHGALHLAGHDHHRPGERRLMRASEERALRAAAAQVRRLDAAFAQESG